jgi:hypothetical protein
MSLTSVKLAPAGFTWHKNRVHFKNIYPMIPEGACRYQKKENDGELFKNVMPVEVRD